jgi:hypothetical protein
VSEINYMAAAAALFNAFTFDRLIPLITLMMLAVLFLWVIFQAQKGADFDASEFLRDDRRKLSWGRLAAFVCCVTHTWVIFTRTLNDRLTFEEQLLYCIVWSGSMILLQALEVWRGVKIASPPPQEPPQ